LSNRAGTPPPAILRFAVPLLIAVAIFLVDSLTRLGGAVAVLYTAVILLVANGSGRKRILWTGAGCAVLTLIAFLPDHLGEPWSSSHVRLTVSLSAIAIITFLAVRTRSAEANFAAQARVLDLTHDTVIIHEAGDDEADIVCYWNDGAAALFGYSREEALGARCQELLRTELPLPRARIEEIISTEGAWSGEIVRTRKDGVRLILSSRWSARQGARGREIIETSADVTEQRLMDRRYQGIFNAAGFAIWEADWSVIRRAILKLKREGVTDLEAHLIAAPDLVRQMVRDVTILDINAVAVRLFKAESREDLIGRSLARSFTPATEAAFARALARVDAGDSQVELETLYQTLTGEPVEVLIRVTVPDSDGNWDRVLITALDLTERNRMQARLNETLAELSHASRISMLGELAASIAHEVNQPLAAVVTYGEAGRRWLSREPLDRAEISDCIKHIMANGRRATEVIGRVRSLAKQGQGQTTRLSLGATAAEAAALLERELRASDVLYREDIAANLPEIAGDRVQLQQVVINLLMNGVQAMAATPEGQRSLTLSVSAIDDAQVRLEVRDTGSGIAPEQAGRLFQSFATTRADGLGMGLSICRSIIEAHHGQISLTNTAGGGASAVILLPVATPEAA
jgi:PAS domain S-box-containing protein